MSLFESNTPDFTPDPALNLEATHSQVEDGRNWFSPRRIRRFALWTAATLLILALVAFFGARFYLRDAARNNLPQLDGTLAVHGLSAPVTVQRDARGVPHITAATLDDLVFAQAFITASDRLFQMDTLRRHAAGELAEVLGLPLLAHDRLQRNLQIRAAADRAIATLPPDQLHLLETYARGVNASIAAQSAHLPVEFKILRYTPSPWTPRDSILVSLAMFEDLTNSYPAKLARESLLIRTPGDQRVQIDQDLYPIGSWRDHPPASPIPDLTIEGPPIEQIPLDESQSSLTSPGAPHLDSEMWDRITASLGAPFIPQSGMSVSTTVHYPLSTDHSLTPGSNNWVVSGAHTASGKPLLANDMHLGHTLPGIWYEADLQTAHSPGAPSQAKPEVGSYKPSGAPSQAKPEVGMYKSSGAPSQAKPEVGSYKSSGAPSQAKPEVGSTPSEPFHVSGVTIPGLPLIVVGHNDHIAWGFTNLGADVQDLYVELLRNQPAQPAKPNRKQGLSLEMPSNQPEFRATDLSWQPVTRTVEPIKIHGLATENYIVTLTRHGNTLTPILDPTLTPFNVLNRSVALNWTVYDPANLQLPTLAVNSARDWPTFITAFSNFGGPAQNVVYADDQGHIGYHAVGRIPTRGPAPAALPAPLPSDIASPVPPTSPGQTPAITATPSPIANTPLAAPPAPAVPQRSGPIAPMPYIPSPAHEWTGYIPFDQLPQVFDPPGGIIATANARITPDDYPYPITLNWAAPYRTERIWKFLAHRTGLKPEDMLALQSDVYSGFDHVLAQRLAYAIDDALAHPAKPFSTADARTLHQAADILRTFNGRMSLDSPAAAILSVVHPALWPALLSPRLAPTGTTTPSSGNKPSIQSFRPLNPVEINALYIWGEKDYALEQILAHTPPRWLPPTFPTWNDFLAATVLHSLAAAKAPADLATLRYGPNHTVDIEHPIFAQSPLLQRIFGLPTGTGPQPQSGDGTTVKQVGHTFGPSERFTADLADLQRSTLNLVLGQSGNPASPWLLDQFPTWLRGTTYPQHTPPTHTSTLTP